MLMRKERQRSWKKAWITSKDSPHYATGQMVRSSGWLMTWRKLGLSSGCRCNSLTTWEKRCKNGCLTSRLRTSWKMSIMLHFPRWSLICAQFSRLATRSTRTWIQVSTKNSTSTVNAPPWSILNQVITSILKSSCCKNWESSWGSIHLWTKTRWNSAYCPRSCPSVYSRLLI